MLVKHGPVVAIPEVQKHGLDVQYAGDALPVLELLDMHNVRRATVYTKIAQAFRERLLPRLDFLNAPQLEALLEKTFPYISIEEVNFFFSLSLFFSSYLSVERNSFCCNDPHEICERQVFA